MHEMGFDMVLLLINKFGPLPNKQLIYIAFFFFRLSQFISSKNNETFSSKCGSHQSHFSKKPRAHSVVSQSQNTGQNPQISSESILPYFLLNHAESDYPISKGNSEWVFSPYFSFFLASCWYNSNKRSNQKGQDKKKLGAKKQIKNNRSLP